jgi:putative endonuclease
MSLRRTLFGWMRRDGGDQTLGQKGEAAAARFLRRKGYRIVARGDRAGPGEIDLVAVHRGTVVFVEVKTRSTEDDGTPAEAVDEAKQRRLTRLAIAFLKRHRLLERPARFDVVAVTWPQGKGRPTIDHIESAFDAVGQWEFFS